MSSEVPLQLEKFIKQRDDFRLGPIDIMLEPGLVYAIVGHNGSGKSTFLKCCMNLIKPSSGHVEIFGKSYLHHEDDIKTQIAFVPEPLEGCENFTLKQMGQMIGQGYPAWENEFFLERAQDFQIPLNKPYGRLSQGERKKVALTLALSTRAPLMLLDEPTNGLDVSSRNHLKKLLLEDSEIAERTVLIATHSTEDIRHYADYIFLLKEGKLEGPYEKDILINSWRRLWLHEGHLPMLSTVPGVVVSSHSPMPQLVTSQLESTLAYLTDKDIVITKEQPVPLEEIIEWMLAEHKSKIY